MAGQRQPTALVVAKGKKHFTKTELALRETSEPRTSTKAGSKIRAPSWLPDALREEFNDLRGQLVAVGIFDRMDRDTLGRYLVAQSHWLDATEQVQAALKKKDVETAEEWSRLQERFFKQCRNCANDLGLTVTSRCKLVVPQAPEVAADNPVLKLLEARNA